MAINKISKNIKISAQDDCMRDLKKLSQKDKAKKLIKRICGDYENKNNYLNLKKAFNLWRRKAGKLKDRDNALREAVDRINVRRHIISAESVNSACLIKRLFNTIPKVHKWNFLNKLRKYGDMKERSNKIANGLKSAHKDLVNKNKSVLVHKIYRLYIYRKLDKMYDNLTDHLNLRIKPIVGKDFLMK